MNELEKVRDDRYTEYEELLLTRDRLRKEAASYYAMYYHEFGELEAAVFEKKVGCIALKRQIAFCQEAENHGASVVEKDLGDYIEEQMGNYYEGLKRLLDDVKNTRHLEYSSEANTLKAKMLYHKISKKLHPDMNPKTAEIPELQELWNRAVAAYHTNNVKELEEIFHLAEMTLEKLGLGGALPDIPDIGEKIEKLQKEIERIRTTEPYTYGELLEDAELTQEKRRSLREELREYTNYQNALLEVINGFKERGVLI